MKRFVLGLALIAGAPHPAAAGTWTFDWAGHVDMDAEGLQSDDPSKRLDAVQALGRYDVSLTQAHLVKALADDDEKVRHAAARALGRGGSLAAVPIMIDWLGDVDPKTRAVAAEALGDIGGPDATGALTRSLGDTDDAVRLRAVKALGAIGKRGNPGVVLALIPRLEDSKPEIQLATIAELEELGDRRAVIPLVAKFSDSSPEKRKAAVRAIGKLGDVSAVPALMRLINDSQEDVRTGAVGALGMLGATDAIDALTEQLGTGGDVYRQKVAYALAQIAASPGAGKAGEDAMHTLVENLASPPQRAGSREALRVGGRAAVPALIAHLQGRIPGDPTSAVALLVDAADPRATATLTAELERGRVAMPLVLKALGATGDPAALVPVLGALANPDASIRLAAMEALRPLLGADARAGDVLIEHLVDGDLEVRVLAAEYLGLLHAGTASARLAALTGPGNPSRLRLAAIDALGEIGHADATHALLDVLREGPAELHAAAATALSYIADPSSIPTLIAMVRTDRGPTRHEVVRALGSTLRGHPDPAARKLLRELALDSSVKVSLSAIAGLAAAGDPADASWLRTMVEEAASDRRRAAVSALGELHDPGAVDALSSALSSREDRLAGAAAWALGELLVDAPADRHVASIVDRWLYLGKHGGWSASINATAGLARLLWASEPANRAKILAGGKRAALFALVFHRSRLVRINVVHALGSLAGDAGAGKVLAQLLHDDPSPHVRIAAARALARFGGGHPGEVLDAAARAELDPLVKAAIGAVQGKTPPLPARNEWRLFYVVDPGADDALVRQEQYFVEGSDDLVWASYTDARGYLTSEHFPAGDATVAPASREADY